MRGWASVGIGILLAAVAVPACSSKSKGSGSSTGGASSGGAAGAGAQAGTGAAAGAGAQGGTAGTGGGSGGIGGASGADAGGGTGGADASTDGPAGVKRVFVTSLRYSGDLKTEGKGGNGVEGADNLCNTRAAALGGTWVAWVSAGASAFDRVKGNGPWYRVDGVTLLFPDRASLKGTPKVAIKTDEKGLEYTSNLRAWTGTAVGGTPVNLKRCNAWTGGIGTVGLVGNINTSDGKWTNAGQDLCGQVKHRLICFEL